MIFRVIQKKRVGWCCKGSAFLFSDQEICWFLLVLFMMTYEKTWIRLLSFHVLQSFSHAKFLEIFVPFYSGNEYTFLLYRHAVTPAPLVARFKMDKISESVVAASVCRLWFNCWFFLRRESVVIIC